MGFPNAPGTPRGSSSVGALQDHRDREENRSACLPTVRVQAPIGLPGINDLDRQSPAFSVKSISLESSCKVAVRVLMQRDTSAEPGALQR